MPIYTFSQSMLRQLLSTTAASLLLVSSFSSIAHTQSRADGHAPIAVMADHMHKKGEMMASYRFMQMEMEDLQRGTHNVSIEEGLEDHMMVPKEMTMKMHMLGMMYAPTDDITLMFMVNYLDNEMTSVMNMSMPAMPSDDMNMMPMETSMDGSSDMNAMDMSDQMPVAMPMMMQMNVDMSSDGMGDSRIGALIRGFEGEHFRTHYTLGLNLPTGDTDIMRTNAMGQRVLQGYPMQLGTNTYNFFAAYTWVYQANDWQYGLQANYETALDENDEDYKPGDKFLAHSWLSYSWAQSFSTSLRLTLTDKDNYSGHDERLNPMMMPTADPKQRGLTQVDFALGANYLFTDGALSGNRIAVEFSKPISENYDGLQLTTDWQATLGWQLAF